MASAPINPTQLTPPRVALIDERTGAISREWYRFFLSLLTSTQNNSDASDTQPDTNSLMATYDAMLASLTQEVQTAPSDLTGSLQQQLDAVFTAGAVTPRNELGTISYLQQDYVPWLTFANIPTNVPPTVGTVFWDGGTTLNVQMTANVAGKINEDLYYYIKASSAITKGQVIMFTGAVGASGVPTGAPATGVTDGSYIMGVAAEDIAHNGFGLIQYDGTLKGLDTSAFSDGDILWYDPAVTGGFTKTKPSAPNVKVQMAAVIKSGSGGSGSILIRVNSGSVLGGTDSNVQFGTLANNDLIQYDSALQYWKNVAPSTITVGTATNLAGGAANRIAYQTGANTTSFIVAPTTANTFLEWSGSAFQWSVNPLGTVTSVNVSGGTTGLSFSGGPITTSGTITMAGTLAVANGGTGATTAAAALTNLGAYPASNPSGYTSNTGTVTSVSGTGTVNGITLTGTVTSSGSLTLGGTLSGVSLTTQVTGTLPVANGGTGATTFTSGYLLKGNGTSAVSVSVAYDNGTQILIGTTTGTAASVSGLLQVQSEIVSKGSLAGFFFENRSGGVTSGSNWYGWYNSGGTTYFYNPAVGNIASINSATGAYTALSDANKKKNIEPSAIGLEALMALKPTMFHMNTDADDAPKQLGFVAQEVKDYIPQAYIEEKNTDASGAETVYIGLNDRPFIAVLVKAVQELTERVAKLEG